MEKQSTNTPPTHAAERAAYWGVSVRTAYKWISAKPPVPVDDDGAMLRWFASLPSSSQTKMGRAFRRKVDELRMQRESGIARPSAPGSSASTTTDDFYYGAFVRSLGTDAGTSPNQDRTVLADLKKQRAFALFKLGEAGKRGDLAAVKDATEALRHISAVIHDEELRAQRLNREIGDSIPRKDCELFGRAIGYWLMRSVDDVIGKVSQPLAAMSASGGLFQEEVRKVLDPVLLDERVMEPLVRATKIQAGCTLPDWFVAAIRDGLAATLEDGAKVFDELYRQPVAPPAGRASEVDSGPLLAPTTSIENSTQ